MSIEHSLDDLYEQIEKAGLALEVIEHLGLEIYVLSTTGKLIYTFGGGEGPPVDNYDSFELGKYRVIYVRRP